MRNIFTLFLFFVISISFSQTNNEKFIYSENSEIQIFYKKNKNSKPPCYSVNGIFLNDLLLESITKEQIKDFKIIKENFNKNGKDYYGKIIIELKPKYSPEFITLTDLSEKYLKLDSSPSIFQINGKIIKANYDEYYIDEKYILIINVDKIKTSKNSAGTYIINLTSKTPENIKQMNNPKIVIRSGLDSEL